MQNIPVNNQTLYALTKDDNALRDMYLNLWFSPKRAEFYKNNGIRIDTLYKKRNEIVKKYFVIENGDVVSEGEGENAKPKLREGMKQEDYDAELKTWEEAENTIKI